MFPKARHLKQSLKPMIDNDSFLLPFTYWERLPKIGRQDD